MRAPTGGRGAWAVVGRSGAVVWDGGSAAAGGRSPNREANRDIFDGVVGEGRMDWDEDTSRYYTKPQKIIQRPKAIYKAPEHYTKTQHIRHILKTFNENRNKH